MFYPVLSLFLRQCRHVAQCGLELLSLLLQPLSAGISHVPHAWLSNTYIFN